MTKRLCLQAGLLVTTFVVGLALGAIGVLTHGAHLGKPLVAAGMRLSNAGVPPVWTATFGTAQELTERPSVATARRTR